MSADVVKLPVLTTLDLPPARVLADAIEEGCSPAIVIGRHANGQLYFASSKADRFEVLWLLERAKQTLLDLDSNARTA